MMPAKRSYVVILMAVFVMIGVGAVYFFWSNGQKEFHLIPQKKAVRAAGPASGAEVGTGWSVKDDPGEAVRQALAMALQGKKQAAPDFAVIFATSGANLSGILAETRKLLGDKTKIYGGTSDSRGAMTNQGFIHTGEKDYAVTGKVTGLAVMTVSSQNICFGVGSADFSRYATTKEGAKAAMRQALENCGKSPQEAPQAVLGVISRSFEDDALEGISEVVGHNVPLLSGTTGGPKFEVLGDREVFAQGISLAAIYTKLPLGWVFEGGFDAQDSCKGVISKVDGGTILEIGGRPAVDVYDEWLGGKIKQLQQAGADDSTIRNLLILNPFYRRYTSRDGQDYFLFSHPWPQDRTLQNKSMETSTRLKTGDEIHLSHGTWERLINRIGNLPVKARIQGGFDSEKKAVLAIGYICAGVMRVVPAEERQKMALLLDYANHEAPFIVPFSWGEQGYFPGVGYKHGNLLTSFLVIGEKETR
jgi:hypothetical protein